MTELETASHSSKELKKDSLEKDEIAEIVHQNDTIIVEKTNENLQYSTNGREEIFMQLQTELFDILLEIYYITPIWGSFKENFYFHWKKIIGATNIKELHAYRLIFRCMGCLRPSSTPLFVLKVIIKQLDEFRRISEPEYYSENIDLNTIVQGQAITGFNSPFTFIQEMKHSNFSDYNIKGKHLLEPEKNLLVNDSSLKQYKQIAGGVSDSDENKFFVNPANTNKTNECTSNIVENQILFSQNDKLIKSVCENMCHMKSEYLNSLYFNLGYFQNADISFERIKNTENNIHCKCESQNKDSLIYNTQNNKNWSKYSEYSDSCGEISDSSCGSNIKSIKNSFIGGSPNSNGDYTLIGSVTPRLQEVGQLARVIKSQNEYYSEFSASNELITAYAPKKRPRRNSEIQGVYFDKIRKLWRANWKENGRVKTKGFSVFQFGDEGAKQRAIEYRKKMEKEFYVTSNNSKNIPKSTFISGKEQNSMPENLSSILVDCNDAFTQNDIENSDTVQNIKTAE
ncbi:hypothetical protein RS030_142102 [Cryptosporidium xiaoi]|uniref:AP2/ERF domain-containing protein n=1 Tax=Cryptosporidium xiaoi TaxID=659607 RepID=A0AAV9Y114_9CRYT